MNSKTLFSCPNCGSPLKTYDRWKSISICPKCGKKYKSNYWTIGNFIYSSVFVILLMELIHYFVGLVDFIKYKFLTTLLIFIVISFTFYYFGLTSFLYKKLKVVKYEEIKP